MARPVVFSGGSRRTSCPRGLRKAPFAPHGNLRASVADCLRHLRCASVAISVSALSSRLLYQLAWISVGEAMRALRTAQVERGQSRWNPTDLTIR